MKSELNGCSGTVTFLFYKLGMKKNYRLYSVRVSDLLTFNYTLIIMLLIFFSGTFENGFLIITGAKVGCSLPEEKTLMVLSHQTYMERATFSVRITLRTASITAHGRRSGSGGMLFPPCSAYQILHQR